MTHPFQTAKQVGEIVIGSYDDCQQQHKREHCYNCNDDRDFTGIFLPITSNASHNRIKKLLRSALLKKLNIDDGVYCEIYDEVIAQVKELIWQYDSDIDSFRGNNSVGENIASIRFLYNPDFY